MEWQKIHSFYNVVIYGSFTKAAEAVFRTQSAISQQMNFLEKEIDCQLFERPIHRRIKLTYPGERLFAFAENTIKGYEQVLGEIRASKNSFRGPLKLGSPYNLLRTILSEKLDDYKQGYPLVELTIYDRAPKVVLDLLDQGIIDIGAVLESICPKNLSVFRWKAVDGFLMTPIGHPLAKLEPKSITLEKIAKYPIISYPKNLQYTSRNFLDKELYAAGLDSRIAMEASSIDLAMQYVKNGLGIHITVLQKDLEGVDQTELSLLPLSHLFEPDNLALVVRNVGALLPYQKKFIELTLGSKID
ncbi:MAG: LysR family transcriptional regulator [Deltaproteobacteria bacterium]|nr:LysR family transcriptional regulator [Deltaproteobacteria bacterium]